MTETKHYLTWCLISAKREKELVIFCCDIMLSFSEWIPHKILKQITHDIYMISYDMTSYDIEKQKMDKLGQN